MRSNRIWAGLALSIFAALVASTLPQTSGTPAAGRQGAVWPSELLARTRVGGGFAYTVEEMISSTPKGPYLGIDQSRVHSAPPVQTVSTFVKFLRAHLPDFAVGRYSYARRVIYLVNRHLLAWRHDPLNQKLSFHGKMSIDRLESHIFSKVLPAVHFYNVGAKKFRSGSGSGVALIPEPKAFTVPMHFDIRGITLRHFLTSGIRYRPGPAGTGRQLWKAWAYRTIDGKFTGRVDVLITADPIVPPSTRKQRAKGK